MLDHQHIVNRKNGRTPPAGPMVTPRRKSRVKLLVRILAGVSWWSYCYATGPVPEVAKTTNVPYVMGAPGTTTTDWEEGTYSNSLPELRIGFRNTKGHLK